MFEDHIEILTVEGLRHMYDRLENNVSTANRVNSISSHPSDLRQSLSRTRLISLTMTFMVSEMKLGFDEMNDAIS